MSSEQSPEIVHGIRMVGELVMKYRIRKNYSQSRLGQEIKRNRNVITLLEQGRRLPSHEDLEALGNVLDLHDKPLWRVVTHPNYLHTIDFQDDLSEMLGKELSLNTLDPVSQLKLIEAVLEYINPDGSHMSLLQAHDHFNTLLTFYGERPVTRAFYKHFLGQTNFESVEQFEQCVRCFQKDAIRIYGSFRKAFKALSISEDLSVEMSPLLAVDKQIYLQRRSFKNIKPIARERLDDLGYISAERVRRQNLERHDLSSKLRELATWVEEDHAGSILNFPGKKLHRVQTLLRRFESDLQIEETLFTRVDPDELRREATRLAPEDEDLARIAETQERGQENLAAYLTEPYMDIYIATSMRERADFISVNTFVETIFSDPLIKPLNLRYFNPTLSWIADRVAKGLVEALMLRRANLTIYMAQKIDTFGKDSEASVALGQGKAVIVYVPRLFDTKAELNSEALMKESEHSLRKKMLALGLELDDALDKQGMAGKILTEGLRALSPEALARILDHHWADFDLYGELKSLNPELRHPAGTYLDELTLRAHSTEPPPPPSILREVLIEKLVQVAISFERRAFTFKEIHPLALQVIMTSGVLNGILVVRSAEACTRMVYEVLTNTIETDLVVENDNYRLLEKQTGSTLRVISRNQLLTNAFWTQYFQ